MLETIAKVNKYFLKKWSGIPTSTQIRQRKVADISGLYNASVSQLRTYKKKNTVKIQTESAIKLIPCTLF